MPVFPTFFLHYRFGMKEVADMFSTFDYVKELQARLPTIGYLRKDTMNDE